MSGHGLVRGREIGKKLIATSGGQIFKPEAMEEIMESVGSLDLHF